MHYCKQSKKKTHTHDTRKLSGHKKSTEVLRPQTQAKAAGLRRSLTMLRKGKQKMALSLLSMALFFLLCMRYVREKEVSLLGQERLLERRIVGTRRTPQQREHSTRPYRMYSHNPLTLLSNGLSTLDMTNG